MDIFETVEVKGHEKCIFETPHNEINYVLSFVFTKVSRRVHMNKYPKEGSHFLFTTVYVPPKLVPYLESYTYITLLTKVNPYLIFVIFYTRANFLENKIYTEKHQFFALNL